MLIVNQRSYTVNLVLDYNYNLKLILENRDFGFSSSPSPFFTIVESDSEFVDDNEVAVDGAEECVDIESDWRIFSSI